MSRSRTKDWLAREAALLAVVHEIVRSIEEDAARYDSIDFLIDLLYSTVVYTVEDYLADEYDTAFQENMNGLYDEPDEATRREVIYAAVDGKNFAERIMEYAAAGLEGFETKLAGLVSTDGHRVRSEGALAAGESLQSVGLTVTKTWRGVMDEKEREAHVNLEGVTVPYDGFFEIDGYTAPAPGLFGVAELDCNCRCELEIRVTE